MKKTWLVYVNSLQRMKALVFGSIAAGLLLGVVLVLLTTLLPDTEAPMRIGYVDNDNSRVSADFETYLTENLGMELVTGELSWLEGELVDKHISAIVEVPAGFERALLKDTDSALLVTYMDDYANRAFLQSYLESYTGSVQLLASSAGGDAAKLGTLMADAQRAQLPMTTVPIDAKLLSWEREWSIFILLFGFFVIFSSLITIGVAAVVFDDRVNKTYQRVQASGVSAVSYVTGVCAAGFTSAIAMVVIALGFALQQGYAENIALGPILLLSLLFVLFCVGFALVAGLVSRTRNSYYWLILAVATIAALLGGAYFPTEYAPQSLQLLAHITPQFWLMDSIRSMAARDANAWVLASCILALFSLLSFLVAGIRFASRQSRSV